MNTRSLIKHNVKRMTANILSIIAILALAFPVTGSASAQDESPYLRAFPDQDFVDGSRWPAEQSVSLTINGTPFEPRISDADGYVTFDLAGYDLQRGDTLNMSSGEAPPVVYQARQLIVDNIDLAAQTVSGTVDGQQTVHVWIGAADEYVDTDGDGNWVINLSGYDNVLYPGVCGNAEAWDAWGVQTSDSSTIIDWCVPLPPLWRDEFDGSLADGWYWVNENSDKWNLTEQPGFLRIYTAATPTGGENLLLRPVAEGDFAIETRVLFTPDTNFQFAGLVIWQDETHFLQLGRAYCYYEESPCVGNGIYFDYLGGGPWWVDGNFATAINNPSDVFLRLERRGDMVRAFYSLDQGITWYEIGIHWIPPDFQVNGVGLTASQDYNTPDRDIAANFDFFELTEGWGFLPEGFHDYDQGDVPDWACNAGGWAADPDNRETDVNIEVVVDDQHVTNLAAGEFRQDLQDAGVCVDGYCSFSTSLWGAISSYEPHRVDIWAQDTTQGDWVLLSNSAKTLTCRTYDIYAYDPLTGTTKQITGLEGTDLRQTGEYDPTWSPNGKLVAHDVVASDSHQIYVTDVKTGVSTVLHGTEDGGNDAAWSPNGKWIAFDRRWFDNDQNIYIVLATGGNRTLAVQNAVTASWAPNGKRIAFQSSIDHSIRTAPVDGGKGGETIIADYGETPAWSPDGNWIAYSRYGDIWKVQVNIQGKVLGMPIQLTSGPFQDGKPTWTPDSQTIIYDSNLGQDSDLWSIPAAGGAPTWLTGAVVFGEYGPANARNSSNVAYASFSPNGQAERTWVAAFTYNAGTWDTGSHTYQFWAQGAPNGDELSFEVSNGASLYDGYALIRPYNVLRAQTPDGCANVGAINPGQETRFHVGWTFDGIYADALTYYDNLTPQVRWDSWEPVDMMRHVIFPLTASVDWFGYTCTFTAP